MAWRYSIARKSVSADVRSLARLVRRPHRRLAVSRSLARRRPATPRPPDDAELSPLTRPRVVTVERGSDRRAADLTSARWPQRLQQIHTIAYLPLQHTHARAPAVHGDDEVKVAVGVGTTATRWRIGSGPWQRAVWRLGTLRGANRGNRRISPDRTPRGWRRWRLFLTVQQHADLLAQGAGGDCGDVVAADDRGSCQAVGAVDSHLGREPANGRGDRGDRHGRHMRAHEFARENEDRPRLVEPGDVDRPHQASSDGSLRACSARPASSGSWPVRARISASRAAIARRRSRLSARVTTAARLGSAPAPTSSSTNSTSSSERRTAICLLIP